MDFDVKLAGEFEGCPVHAVTLRNRSNTRVTVLTYGCIVQSMIVADRNGTAREVNLGYASLDGYLAGHPFFGAVAGRFANRLRDGRFRLNGVEYELERNEAATGQHLHGGSRGFDKAIWGFEVERDGERARVHLHHVSPDGDAGYPGRVEAVHTVGLDEEDGVSLDFSAVSDTDTIINLVNHTYYNLSGVEGSTIEDHELTLAADFYLPVDETMIPTGEVLSTAGTDFDFRSAHSLGAAMDRRPGRDFDHCFVVRADGVDTGAPRLAADLYHPGSGRGMRVFTTQPGVQFYNGFKLGNREWRGRGGARYPAFAGLCLETQGFPDAPNHPQFPSAVLRAGRRWEARTLHRFYRG